jgi:hypothetical protein
VENDQFLSNPLDEKFRIYIEDQIEVKKMIKFILWLILFVLCWPVALLALLLYPLVWLLSLPFRLIGITVTAVFDLLKAILTLPARCLNSLTR